eukprot:2663221-Prymnesium_polylepis.1
MPIAKTDQDPALHSKSRYLYMLGRVGAQNWEHYYLHTPLNLDCDLHKNVWSFAAWLSSNPTQYRCNVTLNVTLYYPIYNFCATFTR